MGNSLDRIDVLDLRCTKAEVHCIDPGGDYIVFLSTELWQGFDIIGNHGACTPEKASKPFINMMAGKARSAELCDISPGAYT